MKSIVWRSLVGVACMSVVLGTAAGAEQKKAKSKSQQSVQRYELVKPGVKVWHQPVWVYVTGSWIPQRVILKGQQVNSASPVYIVQNDELSRTGAVSVPGMLSLDPSIFARAR